jgi:regulator of sigma E protease
LTYAVAIFGLVFLILIHEAGHFAVAQLVHMRPRKFYIFFPPAIWKKTRNGVEYGIGAIPLGGYVKIPGMHRPAGQDLEAHLARAVEDDPSLKPRVAAAALALDAEHPEDARGPLNDLRQAVANAELSERAELGANRGLTDLDDGVADDAYWRSPVWKRISVIAAGPVTNLLFAVALLAVVFALGVPMASTVESVNPNSAAQAAGMQPGDRLVSVDGHELTPVLTDQVAARIRTSDGEPVAIVVERDGKEVALTPTPAELDDGVYRLGFVLKATEESFGPIDSARYALQETWAVTVVTGQALGRIVTGGDRDDVSSPVGIVEGSSDALSVDYRAYLRILALISLSLALLNLLPFLPLDGGHIAFTLLEGARRKPIPRIAYERASALGIVVVLMLFFLGLSNDVNRLSGG